MLMIIIAVVIGVLIALVIYNNPEIIIDLAKLAFYGAIGIGAIFILVMVYFSTFESGSKTTSKMIPVNVKSGQSLAAESVNLALSQYEPINKQCTQELTNKHLHIAFEFNFKKYLIVESSCTPQGGNQNFDYINLIEIDSSGKFIERDAINFRGSLNSINIENGFINIRYAGYAANDPKCCPSLATIEKYKIFDNRLVKK